MNQYAVSPNDQHLWLDDVELVQGDKMLMQLDITPHCIIVLKVRLFCVCMYVSITLNFSLINIHFLWHYFVRSMKVKQVL